MDNRENWSYGKRRRKRRRRRTGPRLALPLLVLALVCLLVLLSGLLLAPRLLGLAGDCSGGGQAAGPAFDPADTEPLDIPPEQLYSSCVLLTRLSDGKILYEKNSGQRTYPASLTKMMTVFTFLETCGQEGESPEQLEVRLASESYTLPYEIFPILAAKHASMAGFQPGETVPYLDLLYACHLPSGADGSMGLAYAAAGSEQGFVDLMNEKAAELGMEDTHFQNVTGLHDPDHYTTAADLSRLLSRALKNQTFRTIFTTEQYEISPTNCHPEGFTVKSTVFVKLGDPAVGRAVILGGKTGYTEEAGLCLATLARKGSQEYILITTGAPGNTRTEQFNATDARAIYSAL